LIFQLTIIPANRKIYVIYLICAENSDEKTFENHRLQAQLEIISGIDDMKDLIDGVFKPPSGFEGLYK